MLARGICKTLSAAGQYCLDLHSGIPGPSIKLHFLWSGWHKGDCCCSMCSFLRGRAARLARCNSFSRGCGDSLVFTLPMALIKLHMAVCIRLAHDNMHQNHLSGFHLHFHFPSMIHLLDHRLVGHLGLREHRVSRDAINTVILNLYGNELFQSTRVCSRRQSTQLQIVTRALRMRAVP